MAPQRLHDLHIRRVALVDQGADQDAHFVLLKHANHKGESAETQLERMAKSIFDRAPHGSMTPEQAHAAALDTPEGRDLYARYLAERPQPVPD